MDFDAYIEECVIKILDSRDPSKIIGTGFWALPNWYALTCFHILQERGHVPSIIPIEFGGRRSKAVYVDELSNHAKDIAVLKLDEEEAQNLANRGIRQAAFAPLGPAILDSDVRAFGYRKGFSEGHRVTGELRPGQALVTVGEVYNLSNTSMPDGASLGGTSGAPVYDPKRKAVVGIFYGEEEKGPITSYVHPMEKVYETWSELSHKNMAAKQQLSLLISDHPLHEYPRGPIVRENIDPRIIEEYAELFADYLAYMIVDKANIYRAEADPDDQNVIRIKKGRLPNPEKGSQAFWYQAFTQARLNGPRMLAALLLVVEESRLPPDVAETRNLLLQKLQSMAQ